ncbi:MAG TPA: sodium:proton antiporter, partial [Lacipirellulaceae bacterium]|nr:sodium:proton antiporter [Lacipirellulaceae bacterium]
TGVQTDFVATVLANSLLSEFIPFIVLLFSLYTIAGGIRISGDLRANPMTNAAFMAAGGLLASFIGTTGAAMLLIRPLLETNVQRRHVAHTVIFFIFIACNCGGCLLPIGDPPLFLGYLQGVYFTWTLSLWNHWALVNGLLLASYLAIDLLYFYRQETVADVRRDIERTRPLSIRGAGLNGPLLVGIVLAVALLDPTKTFPGADWHPWMYLREAVQLLLVAASLTFGPSAPRLENRFNYHAIIEVAALFVGIFICMQPALAILRANGPELVEHFRMGPAKFFAVTGALSAVLDNAPTYLVFFQTARGNAPAVGPTAGVDEAVLAAISLGSVFGGAMTYIGNGPNFMVKAIAEKSGVKMPTFFGYMVYSGLILLPILAINCWLFLLD